ncbi:MAG: DNA translocase FtsK 4TM domain-containing protein [Planctomycetia bacterium]|nr:DNA translocase FtsK 4TM domain-containing protein [Planctomycetia bacterium]
MDPRTLGKIRYYVLSVLGTGIFIFFLLSLYTYDAADPPSTLVFPNNHVIKNVCGKWGAFFSSQGYVLFGLGVWFIMLSGAYHLARFLSGCHTRHPYIRFSGWCVAVLGICSFLELAFPEVLPQVMIGPGGYFGASLSWNLVSFGPVGSMLLSLMITFCGFLVYSEYFIPSCARMSLKLLPRRYVSGMMRFLKFFFGQRAGWGRKNLYLDVGNYPFHGLYCGYINMEMYREWNEKRTFLLDLIMKKPVLGAGEDPADYSGESEKNLDDEQNILRGKKGFHGKGEKSEGPRKIPESEGGNLKGEGQNTEAKDFPSEGQGSVSETAEEEHPTVIVDEKTRKIAIIKPEDNKSPSVLSEDLANVSSSFQAQEQEYVLPSLELLHAPVNFDYSSFEAEVYSRAEILEKIVEKFGFKVKVEEIQLGPVITQYQISLEAGLRVNKIVGLAEDIAVQLGVTNVRIVHPLPGKSNLVGIEIPNIRKKWVYLREVMEELAGMYDKYSIPMFLGKDVAGKAIMTDLAKLPHLLIAGRTGTGKSVCLNSIILSILMTRGPADVKMIMIDPKTVELLSYATIPHLMHPVITDMKKAEAVLAWAVDKMEERYIWLARARVRHVDMYNRLSREELLHRIMPTEEELPKVPPRMPYIVIVADEMADLMMTAPKEVESHIIRLAQKSRAVGIHLILATQKPTVDVITGLIKSNLPARIAFQVSSKTDSRVVLDENGAERLLGNGDMLFLKPGTSILIRGQGTFLSDEEINNVIHAISVEKPQYDMGIMSRAVPGGESDMDAMRQRDELYISAVDIIIREQRGSISLLQRMLGIGYGRAARLIDYMAEDGIVGPFRGYTQPREVLMTPETWEAKQRISDSSQSGYAVTEVPVSPPSFPREHTKTVTEPKDENAFKNQENEKSIKEQKRMESFSEKGILRKERKDSAEEGVLSTDRESLLSPRMVLSEEEENSQGLCESDYFTEDKEEGRHTGGVLNTQKEKTYKQEKGKGRFPSQDARNKMNQDQGDISKSQKETFGEESYDLDSVMEELRQDIIQRNEEDDDEDGDDTLGGAFFEDSDGPPWDHSGGQNEKGEGAGKFSVNRNRNRHRDEKMPKRQKKNRFRQRPRPPQQIRHSVLDEPTREILSKIEPNQPEPFIYPGKVTEIHSS